MRKIATIPPEQTHQAVENERENVKLYIQGYLKFPETKEEITLAEATLHYAFDDESWEEDWEEASMK